MLKQKKTNELVLLAAVFTLLILSFTVASQTVIIVPSTGGYANISSTTFAQFGNYNISATVGSQGKWAQIDVNDSRGKQVATATIGNGTSKEFDVQGFTVAVRSVMADQYNKVSAVNITVLPKNAFPSSSPIPGCTLEQSTGCYRCQINPNACYNEAQARVLASPSPQTSPGALLSGQTVVSTTENINLDLSQGRSVRLSYVGKTDKTFHVVAFTGSGYRVDGIDKKFQDITLDNCRKVDFYEIGHIGGYSQAVLWNLLESSACILLPNERAMIKIGVTKKDDNNAYVSWAYLSTNEPEPPKPRPCTDTDGGKDYSVKGVITGPLSGDDPHNTIVQEDFCQFIVGGPMRESTSVLEHYCKDGFIERETYDCPSGLCKYGTCVSPTQKIITKEVAIQKLDAAGCTVGTPSNGCLHFDGGYWIYNTCSGACRVNAITGETKTPEKKGGCLGVLISKPCKTDYDCSQRKAEDCGYTTEKCQSGTDKITGKEGKFCEFASFKPYGESCENAPASDRDECCTTQLNALATYNYNNKKCELIGAKQSPSTTVLPAITKEQAIKKLKDAGCWYDLSEGGISTCIKTDNETGEWIIKSEGCLGICKINPITGETFIGNTVNPAVKNPMCIGVGLLVEGQCKTDADCGKGSGECSSKYVCRRTSCVPVYDTPDGPVTACPFFQEGGKRCDPDCPDSGKLDNLLCVRGVRNKFTCECEREPIPCGDSNIPGCVFPPTPLESPIPLGISPSPSKEETVDPNTLLEISVRLEGLKIKFDAISRLAKEISDYWSSVGETADANKWRQAQTAFIKIKDSVENTRIYIKTVLTSPTKYDTTKVKSDLKQVSQDVKGILLSL